MDSKHHYLKRAVGFVGMWIVIVAQTILTMMYWEDRMAETIVMDIGILLIFLLGFTGKMVWARILSLALPIGYIIQRLLLSVRYEGQMGPEFFAWLCLPIILYLVFRLFADSEVRLQRQLDIMIEEQKELVMISKTTGLYNLRCLQYDLRMQQAYCERNNLTLALMAVRYDWDKVAQKKIGKDAFREVLKKIGVILVDDVRVEDRVYDLDASGVFGVLMICDKHSMEVVANRLQNVVKGIDFTDVLGETEIVPVVTTTCKEFSKDEFGDDVILFTRTVYNAVQGTTVL